MATDFPGAVDGSSTLPNPTATSKTNNPSLSSGQTNQNDAIKALEAKLGTGASTPSNNTFLIGNGSGTSAYSSLTSAQMAARVSDETGSGSLVFATTPTLVTPKVDTINENTPGNGVTLDGLNVKDSKLNTNDSVVTANITADAVTDAKLIYGKIRSRQGGSATDWSSSGSTTYDYSATNTFMQCGARTISGSTTITFPNAFSQIPGVVATSITAGAANTFVRISAITSSTFTVNVITDAGAQGNETIFWIAVGE